MLEAGRSPGAAGVRVHRFGACTLVVRVKGPCDAARLEAVGTAATDAVESGRAIVVVDLAAATAMEPSCFTAMDELASMLERRGWELVLVRPRLRHVWRWFEAPAAERSLRHFPTQASALEYALARESQL